MNGQTELLEQLSLQMGTTVEYLWGILLKQALISGLILWAYVVLVIISGIVLYTKNKKYMTVMEGEDYRTHYDCSDLKAGTMTSCAIIWALAFLFSIPAAYEGIIALAQPEYWALSKVLNVK